MYACMYFWLCWVFTAVVRLQLRRWGILSSYGAWACYCGNLSPAAQTPKHGEFSSGGAQSELPRAMWSLPGPGIKLVYPCNGRGILYSWTTRKSQCSRFLNWSGSVVLEGLKNRKQKFLMSHIFFFRNNDNYKLGIIHNV